MLRKFKGKFADYARGFHGIYQNKLDRYLVIPDGLDEILLGHSVEQREIFAYKFGDAGKVRILFTGGIHGNEVGTVKLMYKLINHLHDRKFLGLEIYVLPCLNPDGLARALACPDYFGGGRVGRFNANNVDLNRNFATKSFRSENYWFFGDSNIPVYCGEKPFSEPESKLLADFIKERGISILYSFHSRGREVMGNQNELSQRLAQDFVMKSGFKYVSDEAWRELGQTGTIKEWCDENGIAYVEVEASSRYGSDWKNQKDAILGALKYHYG